MKLKLFFLTLVAILCVEGLTVSASAASSGSCGDNLAWTLDSNGLLTIEGSGNMTVYSACNYVPWYSNRAFIKAITIGNEVTSISKGAFYGCTALTEITIPDSVTSIGQGILAGCSSLTDLTIPFVGQEVKTSSSKYQYPLGFLFGTTSYTGGTATKQYYYGSSTSSTTYSTYYIPTTLRSVTVTGGNILYGAFYGCSNLTELNVSASATSIGDYACYKCSALSKITIPSSVKSIGSHAFANCVELVEFDIPNSVVSIGDYAFFSCDKLIDVVIPDSVTSIKEWAFAGCSALKTLQISQNLNSICEAAFCFCPSLTGVSIPQSVTSIGNSAFYNCSSLTVLTIPDSVTSIGEGSFAGCSSLSTISLPENLGCIRSNTFADCSSLSVITIPSSVTSIGSTAFKGCTDLVELTIRNSVVSIGTYAFYDCSSLTSLIIPVSVESIGRFAFYNCSNLLTVAIPCSVESIGESAFGECTSVTDVFYYGDATFQPSIGSNNSPVTDAFCHYVNQIGRILPVTVTSENGIVSSVPIYVMSGELLNLTKYLSPANGYRFETLTVNHGTTNNKYVTISSEDNFDSVNIHALFSPIASDVDIWDGTIAQPTTKFQKDGVYYYIISRCSELAYVAQTGGDWLGYNYILAKNLVLNDVELSWNDSGNLSNGETLLKWTPIGDVDNPFTGIVDGAGYTISGAYINSNGTYCGFFGNCDYATIKNLTLTNSYVINAYGFNQYAGGLIASSYYDTIINCVYSGCVKSLKYAGGLICLSTGSEIQDCHTEGLVKASSYAGGLLAQGNSDTIQGASSSARVVGNSAVGGFIATASNLEVKISNCYSTGNVSGDDCVGGFVGLAYNISINNCCAIGNVSATNGSAGGFVGKTENKYYGTFAIDNCYSFGNVGATMYAGGFVGICYTNISNCYSVGAVSCDASAGGFMGEDRRSWGNNFTVKNCFYLKGTDYNETLCGTGIATADVVGEIEGKPNSLLVYQGTFTNWDFNETWSISPDINGGYPYLQWQEGTLSNIPVTSVQISDTSLALTEGDYTFLTATISPVNASDQSLTWTSSDTSVATVTSAGKVVAISAGAATITAASTNGGYTATCSVTVTERKPEEYKINSIRVREDDGTLLTSVPANDFLATVSITNLASEGDTLVFLAAYTAEGQYKGLMWVSLKDVPVGSTIEVTLPVENSDGTIAKLTAFTVASFSNPVPLGAATEF